MIEKTLILANLLILTSLLNAQQQSEQEISHPILDPSNNLPSLIEPDYILKDTMGNWDESYRTSEEEGERSTQYRFDIEHPPEGSQRIGCICMDGVSMDLKGNGACAGHGGVRFWLYKLKEGEIKQFPTDRHKAHPSTLSEEDLKHLAANNRVDKYGNAYGSKKGRYFSWEEVIATLIICITIAYITKIMWENRKKNHDELPN